MCGSQTMPWLIAEHDDQRLVFRQIDGSHLRISARIRRHQRRPETIEKICSDAGSKSLRFLKGLNTDPQTKSHYNCSDRATHKNRRNAASKH